MAAVFHPNDEPRSEPAYARARFQERWQVANAVPRPFAGSDCVWIMEWPTVAQSCAHSPPFPRTATPSVLGASASPLFSPGEALARGQASLNI